MIKTNSASATVSMYETLKQKIKSKTASIGIIGQGYIGLSLAEAFGKSGFNILAYDISVERMKKLNQKEPYLNFIDHKDIFTLMDSGKYHASSDANILKDADIFIISVPTTLDQYRVPDLSNLRSAFQTVNKYLRKGDLIILQSSTYPGTTEEELLPLIEKSGLKAGSDVFVGAVPEFADIGSDDLKFDEVPRIVSGITPECMKLVSALYQATGCQTVECTTTKVAEAAKLLQNGFRLVNISFINELKMLFDKMGIDVWEVIKVAASKPVGFMPFFPGPRIGGDCIPVAPLYLVWKAKSLHGSASLLEHAANINESMPNFVLNKIIEGLNEQSKTIHDAKILVLGVGYKRDVNDYRESAALPILSMAKHMMADIYYNDPFVPTLSKIPTYPEINLTSTPLNYERLKEYDAVVILTDHSEYDWKKIIENSQLVIDTRNVTADLNIPGKKVLKA